MDQRFVIDMFIGRSTLEFAIQKEHSPVRGRIRNRNAVTESGIAVPNYAVYGIDRLSIRVAVFVNTDHRTGLSDFLLGRHFYWFSDLNIVTHRWTANMGGDFYTYYMLRVIYYEGNRLLDTDCRMEDTIKHHYYPEWSDDEDGQEEFRVNRIVALEREYLNSKLQKYKKSVVFQEGAWICTPQEIRQCMKVLDENDIPWDKVVFIEKYGDYHRR